MTHDDRTSEMTASAPGRSSSGWLAAAMTSLALLAAAAAVVSWDAQYVMVAAARHTPAIAALEAGIPDAGAAVFAALGIALALHGRRALRPRTLNLACVGLSLAMNALAASPGWRDAAIWIMPAAVYALASDTLIGVVRAWTIVRSRRAGVTLEPAENATPLAAAGTCLLWLLRLAVAPVSTLAGLRRWIIATCPTPPAPAPADPPAPQDVPARPKTGADGRATKQDLLLALAGQRYDLRVIPLTQVASIAAGIGGEVDLHAGTARRVLRAHVLALRDHDTPGT